MAIWEKVVERLVSVAERRSPNVKNHVVVAMV